MAACSAKLQTFHNQGERFDRNLILEGHQAMHNNNGKSTSIHITPRISFLKYLKQIYEKQRSQMSNTHYFIIYNGNTILTSWYHPGNNGVSKENKPIQSVSSIILRFKMVSYTKHCTSWLVSAIKQFLQHFMMNVCVNIFIHLFQLIGIFRKLT